jgi:hypothetical protein
MSSAWCGRSSVNRVTKGIEPRLLALPIERIGRRKGDAVIGSNGGRQANSLNVRSKAAIA